MLYSITNKLHNLSKQCCNSMTHLKQILTQIIHSCPSNNAESLPLLLAFAATSPHGDINFAFSVFTHFNSWNSFAYNSIIRGLVNARLGDQALLVYLQMGRDCSPVPDSYTFPFILKACTSLSAARVGESVHARIVKMGFLSDQFILSALVRMYSEFGEITYAQNLFDGMSEGDSVLWNSLIGGYLRCGDLKMAVELFKRIPDKDKNVGTYNAMIGGYAKFGFLDNASSLFDQMPVRDVVSWNAIIGAYSRAGDAEHARKLFDCAPQKNAATWSAIISGFQQSSKFSNVLSLFSEMVMERTRPTQAILVSVFSSISHLGALEQGIWVHGYIKTEGFEIDDMLGSSVIDMYSKCGLLEAAVQVFSELKRKRVCSWTSMIYGLAIHGHCQEALNRFEEMEEQQIKPNYVTFLACLCACSHGGLVQEGREVFDKMQKFYNMEPKIEHYTCMIDLLSKANLSHEARDLIQSMKMKPDVSVWGALVGGRRIHDEPSTTNIDEEELMKLNPNDSGAYVLVSNIYASIDRWNDSERMRKVMDEIGVKKNAGCSSIEADGYVHEFFANGRVHPESVLLYETLNYLYRTIGGV